MIDWNTIIRESIPVLGMLAAFWMGSRLAQGESVMPRHPGKLEVIEPEEPEEDKYGEIWPKDPVLYNDEEDK